MADNVAITAGSGTTIAADDVGAGVLVQRVKATWGPDGTANDADVATGKPLPIQVRSATGLVPLGEPTDAKNTATDTTSVSVVSVLKQISASVQGATPAGEAFVGQTGGSGDVLDVTLSLDTSAYADGDVMADTQSVASAFRVATGQLTLNSVVVLDEDDQGVGFDIIFLDTNNSLGTENSAPNISDANARTIIGRVNVSASDFIDLGGSRLASISGIGLKMKAASGSTTLYVGTIVRSGTPTYTASGVKLKLGVYWE
jgi:hypothetical protein